ncbi:MAG: dephospho-CoA kinase [Coriobacteriia bacterium]|nr:dephospho-CoA kinase [Coriobacteriia bacterium]
MYVLAVTGGIGSGKSTAARMFGALGAVVIDLDELARRLIAPDGPLVSEVAAAFGTAVLDADGEIDHEKLAAVAFADAASAKRLDAIVHPGVFAAVAGALDALLDTPEAPKVVVIDIPLLVESPIFFELVDGVLVISSDEDARLARVTERGLSEDEVRARMMLQASDAERRDVADFIIENDRTIEEFEAELLEFWAREMAHRAA